MTESKLYNELSKYLKEQKKNISSYYAIGFYTNIIDSSISCVQYFGDSNYFWYNCGACEIRAEFILINESFFFNDQACSSGIYSVDYDDKREILDFNFVCSIPTEEETTNNKENDTEKYKDFQFALELAKKIDSKKQWENVKKYLDIFFE